MDEDLIECFGIGGVLFTDEDDRKFYAEYQANDLNVKFGDCVRVKLEDDTQDEDDFSFAQVLAIYERADEEMFIEIRWLHRDCEISPKHRKMISPQQNELIESCVVDDIPAGAVTEVIDIKGADPSKRLASGYFICRYLESEHSSALQKVSPHSLLQRGMEMSHFGYAYADYLQDQDGATQSDPFRQAIQRLHISVIPDTLPCREAERRQIEDYLRSGVASKGEVHRPIYICGMPGTGKTATVLACINQLRREVAAGSLPDFSFIEINCLRLKSPYDAYTLLWRGLTGVHVAPKTARNRLTAYFDGEQQLVGATGSNSNSSSNSGVTVCLVDEMDYLISRSFEVMYHFYSWPQHASANFVLVGIANTMDLPERLSARINSRTEAAIERVIFRPYNFEQIQQILAQRLADLQLEALDDKLRLCIARRAASVAGDLRAALKICQRTIDLYRDWVAERRRVKALPGKAQASHSSSSAGAAGSSAAEAAGAGAITFGEFNLLVKEAANSYVGTPFIATTARACQLDKALLAVMGRHRQSVSGGEGAINEAAMTCDAIWERLCDITQKIDAERYLNAGSAAQVPVAGNAGGPGAAASQLRQPPFSIFTQALDRLCNQGIVVRASTWKVVQGPRSVLYSLHPGFTYSDLTAALNGDPMLRFCSH